MMWKWTDADNIKAIIIDCASLSTEFIEYNYEEIIPKVKIIKALDYYDFNSLIKDTLECVECDSSSVISISSDPNFMKNMLQYHIGTIFAGKVNIDLLKNAPDFTYKKQEKLNSILTLDNYGYGAEVMAVNIKDKMKSLLVSNIYLDDMPEHNVNLYFGGRYFSKKHHYLEDDPLSELLLGFKWKYYEEVDKFYDAAINVVNKIESIDVLIYVPLKPQDIDNNKFNRFPSLHLEESNKIGIHLQNGVKCEKNFEQKSNDYNSRQINVSGAYKLTIDVIGKHVVVLDDLYTSGATIKEISKILYENGAKKVSAIFLAINQTTESTSVPYQNLICPECESIMTLKIGQHGLFFGCENYKEHMAVNTTMNVIEGLKLLKKKNAVKDIDVFDLDDTY